MNKDSAGSEFRPRARRKRENKTASILFLASVTFLLIICGILYSMNSKQTSPGQKQTVAEHIPTGTNSAKNDTLTKNGPSGNKASSKEQAGSFDAPPATTPVPGELSSDDAEPKTSVGTLQGETAGLSGSNNGTSAPKQENDSVKTSGLSGQDNNLPTSYVIQEGDTLSTISMKFYHSKQYVNLLADQNHIVFINDMNLGDTIKIPALSSDGESAAEKKADNIDYAKIALPVTYFVRAGDTLYHIAMIFYHSNDYVDLIAKHNKLDMTAGLKAGSSLIIPAIPVKKAATEHTVKQGETLSSISRKYFGSSDYVATIAKYNHLADGDNVKIGDVLKIPSAPTQSKSSKQFG